MKTDMNGRISYTVKEAVSATGISRWAIYQAIGTGELKTFKVGRRRMVSHAALHDFINRLEQQGEAGARAA